MSVVSIILAGGKGTRLFPLTMHHCKPAMPFGGKYRLIDIALSNSINSGYQQIFVIAQYLSAELQHYINQTYPSSTFSKTTIDILSPEEKENGEREWFLGTADAIRKTLPTLLKTSADYFLILSSDQLYNIDLRKMVSFAQETKADLTIAATPVEKSSAHRLGLIKIHADATIDEFFEKPEKPAQLKPFLLSKDFYHQRKISNNGPHYLASMGIYLFHRDALIRVLKNSSGLDFGHHLLKDTVKQEKSVAFIHSGYWEDIGTVATYYRANLSLLTQKKRLNIYDEQNPIYARPTFLPGPQIGSTQISHSLISDGSLIDAKIIEQSVIGMRSHIKKGTVVRNSVLFGNDFYLPSFDLSLQSAFWIGEKCWIENAIIDEHVRVGNRVRLINKKRLSYYDGNGIYIRDGIIIVMAGTTLPDGFLL